MLQAATGTEYFSGPFYSACLPWLFSLAQIDLGLCVQAASGADATSSSQEEVHLKWQDRSCALACLTPILCRVALLSSCLLASQLVGVAAHKTAGCSCIADRCCICASTPCSML